MRKTHKPIHPSRGARLTAEQIKSWLTAPEEADPEQLDSLRLKPFAVIRQLADEDAVIVLQRYLEEDYITAEICSRFLLEENPPKLGIRLALMQAAAVKQGYGSTSIARDAISNEIESASIEGESNSAEGELVSAELTSALIDRPSLSHNLMKMNGEQKLARWSRHLSIREPALRLPLNAMGIICQDTVQDFGTDGTAFLWNSALSPEDVRPDLVDFQHMVIHCLYGHVHIPRNADPVYWNIAADLAAEYLRGQIFPHETISREAQRRITRNSFIYSEFPNSLYPGNVASVYQWLCQNTAARELEALGKMFRVDDHALWKKNAPLLKYQSFTEGDGGGGDAGPEDLEEYNDTGLGSRVEQAISKLWNEALEMQSVAPHKPRRGTAPGSRRERMILHEKAQFDFRRYLRRYSVIQEELQLDMDSFDYIPYTMGLQLYGNMPLMEPLEYTEAFKVEQLVIAIDTSGSCDTATVQRFLAEVQNILTGHDNFFRKMEVHILQCDSYVHEHKVIHSVDEWTEYIRDIVIRGRGGTDFTPVFRYVENLQKEGQAQRLKGLIYFTDGDGVYPKKEPPYEVAFAFSTWDFRKYRMPDWIIQLCLEETPY